MSSTRNKTSPRKKRLLGFLLSCLLLNALVTAAIENKISAMKKLANEDKFSRSVAGNLTELVILPNSIQFDLNNYSKNGWFSNV